jgi:digeranylgeranylglycerophospholipid reductase
VNVHRTCDVLVVGAGPAGSAAARAAARQGVSVLLAERRLRVGVPVRCAEFVPLPVGKYIDLSNPAITVQPVRAMRTFVPGADPKENLFPGAMIRRDRFDQELARQATEAGALLETGLQVYRRTPEGIRAWDGHREVSIRCRVIVGPTAPVPRWPAGWVQPLDHSWRPPRFP